MSNIVRSSRARSTGTLVELVDNRDGSFDLDDHGWITACVEHGNYCSHETRKLGESFMAAPEEWCDLCGALTALGRAPNDEFGVVS